MNTAVAALPGDYSVVGKRLLGAWAVDQHLATADRRVCVVANDMKALCRPQTNYPMTDGRSDDDRLPDQNSYDEQKILSRAPYVGRRAVAACIADAAAAAAAARLRGTRLGA